MSKVRWTEQAVADLQSIREFIERDSPTYGRLMVERLFDATERLEVNRAGIVGDCRPSLLGRDHLLMPGLKVQAEWPGSVLAYRVRSKPAWLSRFAQPRTGP